MTNTDPSKHERVADMLEYLAMRVRDGHTSPIEALRLARENIDMIYALGVAQSEANNPK